MIKALYDDIPRRKDLCAKPDQDDHLEGEKNE